MDDMTVGEPVPIDARITRVEGSVMPVNSYVVDCGDGVVVVDAQLCVSDAAAVRSVVDETGKPLLAVLLTHPHPDHYAGAAVLTEGLDVPLVSTAAVADVAATDDETKAAIVGPMMGAEWPAVRRFPDRLVADDAVLTYGDLAFTVASWGPAESHADTTWSLGDGTVFAGDVVYDAEHAYLADGHAKTWLVTLERFGGTLAPDARLLPGHGAGGGPVLVECQQTYVRTFLDALTASADLDAPERDRRVLDAVRPLASSERTLFLTQLSIEPMLTVLGDDGATT